MTNMNQSSSKPQDKKPSSERQSQERQGGASKSQSDVGSNKAASWERKE